MNKLKETRLKAELTQKEMSDMLEIPVRTIQDWEREERKPPVYVEKLVLRELERIIIAKSN